MADVILVGGGLTGGTLGCALAEKGLEVTIVDQIDPHIPTLSDGRSFALSRSSYNIFLEIRHVAQRSDPHYLNPHLRRPPSSVGRLS